MQRRLRVCAELPPRHALGAASRSHTRAPASRAISAAHRAALPPPITNTSVCMIASSVIDIGVRRQCLAHIAAFPKNGGVFFLDAFEPRTVFKGLSMPFFGCPAICLHYVRRMLLKRQAFLLADDCCIAWFILPFLGAFVIVFYRSEALMIVCFSQQSSSFLFFYYFIYCCRKAALIWLFCMAHQARMSGVRTKSRAV